MFEKGETVSDRAHIEFIVCVHARQQNSVPFFAKENCSWLPNSEIGCYLMIDLVSFVNHEDGSTTHLVKKSVCARKSSQIDSIEQELEILEWISKITRMYTDLTYTSLVNSVYCTIWLVPLSRNILHYLPQSKTRWRPVLFKLWKKNFLSERSRRAIQYQNRNKIGQ